MKLCLIIFSALTITLSLGGNEPTFVPKEMAAAIESVQKNGQFDPIQKGIRTLDNAGSKLSAQEKLNLYLDAAEMFAKLYSQEVADNPPVVLLNVSPGLGYESGVSPDSISDPATRKSYEKALAENQSKAKILAIQRCSEKALDILASRVANILQSGTLSESAQKTALSKIESRPLPERFKLATKRGKSPSNK